MSSITAFLDTKQLIKEVEPVLVSHYRSETGNSPTLNELKQYLVTQATEHLVEILKNSDSSIIRNMSAREHIATINLYIRKLRVW